MPSAVRSRGVAHTGKLQQLGRIDSTAAADDFAAIDPVQGILALDVLNPHGPFPLKRIRLVWARQMTVRLARFYRVQVGPRGTQATPAIDIAVEGTEAFLPDTVDIIGQRIAGLLHRLEKGLKQGVLAGTGLKGQRAVDTVVFIGPDEAGFRPFEIGQVVGVVPVLHARHPRPTSHSPWHCRGCRSCR